MKEYKVPIQSLIDHIKTAIDVDPWAKEMAEELLKECQKIVRCKDCEHYDEETGRCAKYHVHGCAETWFCGDGERKTE